MRAKVGRKRDKVTVRKQIRKRVRGREAAGGGRKETEMNK